MKALTAFLFSCICCCAHAQQFPPPGFKEMESGTSPQESFRIVSLSSDSVDKHEFPTYQVWIQALELSDAAKWQLSNEGLKPPVYKTQLLCEGQASGWFISDNEYYIALNIHVASNIGELHIFSHNKDGIFNEVCESLCGAVLDRVQKQLHLKKELDLDHIYFRAVEWIRNGVLFGYVNGHHSDTKDSYYLEPWYFIYDFKNDRFISGLSEVNNGALQHQAPPKTIYEAAKRGDLKMVKLLVKNHPGLVLSKDSDGDTPLHLAAITGQIDMMKLLLANKADVNAKSSNGSTPLHTAVWNESVDAVKLLLSRKADVNARDDGGDTPLHMAVLTNQINVSEIVKLLLDNGANVNATDINDETPLHFAARCYNSPPSSGLIGAVKLLLVNKADVNAEDCNGNTPLDTAESGGHENVAEFLRQHGGHE